MLEGKSVLKILKKRRGFFCPEKSPKKSSVSQPALLYPRRHKQCQVPFSAFTFFVHFKSTTPNTLRSTQFPRNTPACEPCGYFLEPLVLSCPFLSCSYTEPAAAFRHQCSNSTEPEVTQHYPLHHCSTLGLQLNTLQVF